MDLRAVPNDPSPADFPVQRYACDDRPYLCYRCRMASCWAQIPMMFRGAAIKSAAEFDRTQKLMEKIQ